MSRRLGRGSRDPQQILLPDQVGGAQAAGPGNPNPNPTDAASHAPVAEVTAT